MPNNPAHNNPARGSAAQRGTAHGSQPLSQTTWFDGFDAGGVFELPRADVRAFIFDCDGTLANTMPLHFEAWRYALSTHGARIEFEWSLFLRRAGMSLERTVVELNAEFGETLVPELIATTQREFFARHRRRVTAVDAVVEFARLAGGRHPISVASGSRRAEVEATLRAIGVDGLFPVIVTPEDVLNGKPAPDMFLLAAEHMGVRPEHCAVFEDAELGLEAARRAGMQAILVNPPGIPG